MLDASTSRSSGDQCIPPSIAVNAANDVCHMAKRGLDSCALSNCYHSGVDSRHFLFGGTIVQCLATQEDVTAHNDGTRAPKQH